MLYACIIFAAVVSSGVIRAQEPEIVDRIVAVVNDEPVKSIADIERISRETEYAQRTPMIVLEPDGTIARKVIRP